MDNLTKYLEWYNKAKLKIESKLNGWEIVYLYKWEYLTELKLSYKRNKDINDESYYEDSLPMALSLIWKLIKEKKVKAQKYEIEEYEKPREIEKVMFWWKIRKKYITSWVWKPVWRLDPCKYEDNEKLEEEVEIWKKQTLELYKYVLEKYGQDKANRLLDILEIVRSDCYEWEIRIE